MLRGARSRIFSFVAVFMFTAIIAVAADTVDILTLSIRTKDGLAVVEAQESEIENWKTGLAGMKNPPSTNLEVLSWLLEEGVEPQRIRLYLNLAGKISSIGRQGLEWEKTTIKQAVRSGQIPNLTSRPLHEVYTMLRSAGISVLLSDKLKNDNIQSHHDRTIFVLSSAFHNGREGIFVDGRNLSKGGIGYNIVAYPPDGDAISETFELYDKPDDGPRMASFLNSLPEGTYIAAEVNFGPGVFLSGGAISALQSYGSMENLDPELLSSHAMIGKKGLASGLATEVSEVNLGSSVIEFSDDIFVGTDRLENIIGVSVGKTVVITGTEPSDIIYILK
ncbi:MAG TPA: interleukin-like EMT inducer domain-containing protein [bacterium]|nr:interleukin-like EMT inducer domain-containing protein [bacterium]